MPEIEVYHQVAVASGTRLVFVTGQVAWNAVPDLAAQVEEAYLNVGTALDVPEHLVEVEATAVLN